MSDLSDLAKELSDLEKELLLKLHDNPGLQSLGRLDPETEAALNSLETKGLIRRCRPAIHSPNGSQQKENMN